MKLAYAASNVVASEGVQTTSSFGIARTPHMFNILSSGLYSDKIAAVLREISCNAMDAHIMLGKPELPFQVKLPTTLDRSFYVKDWGPGLDDREVRELYTTYGYSSKQNDDNVTGAFGLGSKSPFAYTMQNEEDSDGFTIVAVKDGIKRIYTCYIGAEGGPAISRMHEGPADEDWTHGVMVTFPVQTKDVSEFHRKAGEVFRWFKVKPELLGLSGSLETPRFEMSGSFFSMKPLTPGVANEPCVITGNVRYPINANRLTGLAPTEAALVASGVHLFLPIGEVMMTPSREELQYTEDTKRNLKKHLAVAATEVAERVRQDVMTPMPTMWEWYRKIQSYYDTLPSGIQRALADLLRAAGVSDDEVRTVIRTVSERYATVPTWIGDGIGGPLRSVLRDGAGSLMRDADGEPLYDSKQDARGARVWLYSWDEPKKMVRRKEIIRGFMRHGSADAEQVKLSFLQDIHVYYTDAKRADARVRGLVRESHCTTLLVAPCRGTPASFTKDYAERMGGKSGLDGLPVRAVSEVEVPSYVAEEKERRKRQREQTPREFFSDQEVKFMDMAGELSDITLGELEEDTDHYYICARKLDKPSRTTFRNDVEDETYSFSGYYREQTMRSIGTLLSFFGKPIPGVIVVAGEGAARRMKFAEQGIKPFLPWLLDEALQDEAKVAKLKSKVNRYPKVDLSSMYTADDYGWVGILAHHALGCTPFWQKFMDEFPHSPVTATVLDFMSKCAGTSESQEATGIVSAWSRVASRVTNNKMGKVTLETAGYYEIKEAFEEHAPTMALLSEAHCVEAMTSNPTQVLALFRTALEADGLAGSPGSIQTFKLAA